MAISHEATSTDDPSSAETKNIALTQGRIIAIGQQLYSGAKATTDRIPTSPPVNYAYETPIDADITAAHTLHVGGFSFAPEVRNIGLDTRYVNGPNEGMVHSISLSTGNAEIPHGSTTIEEKLTSENGGNQVYARGIRYVAPSDIAPAELYVYDTRFMQPNEMVLNGTSLDTVRARDSVIEDIPIAMGHIMKAVEHYEQSTVLL